MRILLALLLSVATSRGDVRLGNEVGANGDAISAWFVASATAIVALIEQGQRERLAWAAPIDAARLRGALATTVILVDSANRASLQAKYGSLGDAEVVAGPLILLDRETWENLWRHQAADLRQILHLYLEASGQSDRHFRLSARVPFPTASGPRDNKKNLPTLWRKSGEFALPVTRSNGFSVVEKASVRESEETADTIVAFNEQGHQQWRYQAHYPWPGPSYDGFREHVQLWFDALATTEANGVLAIGVWRAGSCQNPFVVKLDADGHEQWLRKIVSPGIHQDCWERAFDKPIAIAEVDGSTLVVFERRVVRLDAEGGEELTEKMSGFSYDQWPEPSALRWRALVPGKELLLLGAIEEEGKLLPLVKILDRRGHELSSRKFPEYPGDSFTQALRLAEGNVLVVKSGASGKPQLMELAGEKLTAWPARYGGNGSAFVSTLALSSSGFLVSGLQVQGYQGDELAYRAQQVLEETFLTGKAQAYRGFVSWLSTDRREQRQYEFPGISVRGVLPLSGGVLIVQQGAMRLVRF